ncbi:hypothetical protein [Microbacterium sp. GXF0217]
MADRVRRRQARLRDRRAPRFALFGETLLVGIAVLVLSVPLVTLLPALVAGARHLRRHATGESDRVRDLIADFAGAVRRLWLGGLALAAGLAFVVFDCWVLTVVEVPNETAVRVALAIGVTVVVVLLLRFVGSWTPDAGAAVQWRRAVTESRLDLGGSALLLLAGFGAGILVWMFPAFVLLAGGILCLAAYGVDVRLQNLSEA